MGPVIRGPLLGTEQKVNLLNTIHPPIQPAASVGRKPRARWMFCGWMVHDETLGAAFGPTLDCALRLWYRCRLIDATSRA